jgi:hypothetical protein
VFEELWAKIPVNTSDIFFLVMAYE